MRLADHLYTSGALEEHRAGPLYAHVLRDPTPLDWLVDPMESLAALTTPNIGAYQNWLQVTINRKEQDKASGRRASVVSQLKNQQFTQFSQRHLRDLRRDAVIEYPNQTGKNPYALKPSAK